MFIIYRMAIHEHMISCQYLHKDYELLFKGFIYKCTKNSKALLYMVNYTDSLNSTKAGW